MMNASTGEQELICDAYRNGKQIRAQFFYNSVNSPTCTECKHSKLKTPEQSILSIESFHSKLVTLANQECLKIFFQSWDVHKR